MNVQQLRKLLEQAPLDAEIQVEYEDGDETRISYLAALALIMNKDGAVESIRLFLS